MSLHTSHVNILTGWQQTASNINAGHMTSSHMTSDHMTSGHMTSDQHPTLLSCGYLLLFPPGRKWVTLAETVVTFFTWWHHTIIIIAPAFWAFALTTQGVWKVGNYVPSCTPLLTLQCSGRCWVGWWRCPEREFPWSGQHRYNTRPC